jgi:hypothetical protein
MSAAPHVSSFAWLMIIHRHDSSTQQCMPKVHAPTVPTTGRCLSCCQSSAKIRSSFLIVCQGSACLQISNPLMGFSSTPFLRPSAWAAHLSPTPLIRRSNVKVVETNCHICPSQAGTDWSCTQRPWARHAQGSALTSKRVSEGQCSQHPAANCRQIILNV